MDITWIQTLTTFLWAYVLVGAVSWVRAVRAEALNTHIGHFIGLCGVLVPGIAATLLIVVFRGYVGFPLAPVFALLMMPGCLLAGFLLELNRIRPFTVRSELLRLSAVVGVSLVFI